LKNRETGTVGGSVCTAFVFFFPLDFFFFSANRTITG
jgi:hypothetical protein